MARLKEFTRYNVISVRITDDEMKALKQMREMRKTSMSQLLREALATTELPVGMGSDDGKVLPICSG